jgi:transposase-like protein
MSARIIVIIKTFSSIFQILDGSFNDAFLIDETMIQIGYNDAWLRVAIEPIHKMILGVYLSRHRDMLVAETFLKSLVKSYGKHIVYSDGGSWYPEAYVLLLVLSIDFILLLRKASLKDPSNI